MESNQSSTLHQLLSFIFEAFPIFSRRFDDFAVLSLSGKFFGWKDLKFEHWDDKISGGGGLFGSGPLVIFNKAQDIVIVISCASQFFVCSHSFEDGILTYGLMGSIPSIEKNWQMETIVYVGNQGVTKAVLAWGKIL